MLRETLHAIGVLLVVTSVALLASCATTVSMSDPTVKVRVAGTPEQLAAFDQALRPLLGAEPIGCTIMLNGSISGCEILKPGPVSTTLTDLTYDFAGPHTPVFEKFGAAFNQVPKQFNPDKPTLTISPFQPPRSDCSLLPQPCVGTPWCGQYAGCSQQRYPCAKCQ